ncbi:hypothetical protein LX32DRAFT_189386 [Colletotrichum zoysiae]|uniref:Uncharacterized protein n=1 Tax=Colletotrichum zoysiae TaxID=1216348 RepID=A0AAD9HQQ6_9PEZI|nr:hypothetical protein LX32DRAFT_189386 [Colletotrichum zoysiae]
MAWTEFPCCRALSVASPASLHRSLRSRNLISPVSFRLPRPVETSFLQRTAFVSDLRPLRSSLVHFIFRKRRNPPLHTKALQSPKKTRKQVTSAPPLFFFLFLLLGANYRVNSTSSLEYGGQSNPRHMHDRRSSIAFIKVWFVLGAVECRSGTACYCQAVDRFGLYLSTSVGKSENCRLPYAQNCDSKTCAFCSNQTSASRYRRMVLCRRWAAPLVYY